MANRIEAVLSGLASLCLVADAHIAEASKSRTQQENIEQVCISMEALLLDESGSMSALALSCAVINTIFAKTGVLIRVDEGPQIAVNNFFSSADRKAIMALMQD